MSDANPLKVSVILENTARITYEVYYRPLTIDNFVNSYDRIPPGLAV